ncbi:DUF6615 family protein [Ruegeria arenilitoris]|uniref:DUF6615 family protein n=1 Tax=Ruegeria arenilitoris TaxID=1173585 RepID=UPI00147C722C|nr:DUF6615 family protein [Ruegeria arenilitoris]
MSRAVHSSIRDYLRQRAGWVWNEQGHAFRRGLCLQEETLTEMLLLRMAKDQARHGLRVRMFSKAEEKLNGADWEWFIRTPSCSLGLRVQAKRLYLRSTKKDYGGLDPKSGQVNNLISMAGGNHPVYVFFNHAYGVSSASFTSGGEAGYRGRSFWGCTIASAHKVKAANSNSLKKLKLVMKPWHHLVQPSGVCGANAILGSPRSKTQFAADNPDPQWLQLFQQTDFLQEYLEEHELAGVAYLDFKDFRRE